MNNTPPEVIEKWRAEFESWYKNRFREFSIRKYKGDYYFAHAKFRWDAWQESRQSACIDIPEQSWSSEGPLNDMRNSTIEHCREVIESQGYKVNN